ncbi:MFS transporter [Pikeienuella sp. HZG-20]|uniref:MFS transporter n=1 Tax=Paludibacillus litoralis TaxID=3133267 RepID=UPI0030EF29CE
MINVLRHSWALLLGMFLLMIGNGLQGSLIGVRGDIEGFDPAVLSYVISAYFAGFLGGSWLAPALIRNVGHVRVFAAMASLISAAFILYAAVPNLLVWGLLRLLVGFCYSSVYVVAESWLNDASDNTTRGKSLSVYMVVQMFGIVTAQGLLNFGDPAGYELFVAISVLVSISFTPILLSASPAPIVEHTAPMTLRRLFQSSPLGFVGSLLIGAVYSALFGMSAVFGTVHHLTVAQIAAFVAAIYVGGLFFQGPIGWISDRVDRRRLIIIVSAVACVACVVGMSAAHSTVTLYIVAFMIGGMANPLYALLIAHTNDFLERKDMPSASSGLVFIGGVGAIGGPLIVGQLMQFFGGWAYFAYILACMGAIVVYGVYRMTRRAAPSVEETGPFAVISPAVGTVAAEIAQEHAIEQMPEEPTDADSSEELAEAAPNA